MSRGLSGAVGFEVLEASKVVEQTRALPVVALYSFKNPSVNRIVV